jgi:septal ring factor EnvC (AmiA/AmiB activator)
VILADTQLLPVVVGGSGLAGLGAVGTALFLLRSQRDNNVADAAKKLVEGSTALATGVNVELASTRDELASARGEIRELGERVTALSAQISEMRELLVHERDLRLKAEDERDQALAQLGGRRDGDHEGA